MPTLEQITYEAGRDALADQESVVAGIRQRTGTLLAAQSIVASFLGAAAIRAHGVHLLAWAAIATLVVGLALAAAVLSPWKLKFAVDANELYADLYDQAFEEAEGDTLGWLAAAGFGFQKIRKENEGRVQWLTALSAVLSVVLVAQTLLWLAALGLD